MEVRVAPGPGIVGRDPVLATCTSALEAARSGSGGLVLLAGEPGIGKTTVLQAVAARARSDGFVVTWAACVEDDAVPAFWPVISTRPPLPDRAASSADVQVARTRSRPTMPGPGATCSSIALPPSWNVCLSKVGRSWAMAQ